jgi:hypothetical protein
MLFLEKVLCFKGIFSPQFRPIHDLDLLVLDQKITGFFRFPFHNQDIIACFPEMDRCHGSDISIAVSSCEWALRGDHHLP